MVDSDVAAYRLFQKRIGTSRVVVVTPSTYGVDNRATLDGVAQLGPSARAVVVVDQDVADAELKQMAGAGGRRHPRQLRHAAVLGRDDRRTARNDGTRRCIPSAGTSRST